MMAGDAAKPHLAGGLAAPQLVHTVRGDPVPLREFGHLVKNEEVNVVEAERSSLRDILFTSFLGVAPPAPARRRWKFALPPSARNPKFEIRNPKQIRMSQ
jgi:hypothetical protein